MRWGILLNLAVILTVSGGMIFLVFIASFQKSAVDLKIREAASLTEFLSNEAQTTESVSNLWNSLRNLCKGRGDLGAGLYDTSGRVIATCGNGRRLNPPDPSQKGARIRVSAGEWTSALFRGSTIISDLTKNFPHDIGTIRIFLDVPPAISSLAGRLFTAYLILTQAALFFLGYILFHRTVIGPLQDAARLAAQASGITDHVGLAERLSSRGDIQKISSGLRTMIMRIVEDRGKMENLIDQLRTTNADLNVAQQGLIRSEKLAGVGKLAAGLAHEIGNPLQVLMGYAELLQRRPTPETTDDISQRMERELQRIHEILKGLLDFARPLSLNTSSCDLNALVWKTAELIQVRKDSRDFEIEYALDPTLPHVDTDAEKIRQILLNILFNAGDALPETGGRIIVRTSTTENGVKIIVEDNGSGIPEEYLGQVFDPFFTTKEPGKGTGLGLAVCMGLVESLNGSLEVQSKQGHGTSVVMTLPKAREENFGGNP